VHPCWHGTGHRHGPGYPRGRSCRTAHRSDSQVLPSLSRVTPSAASERYLELLGCPIPTPSPLRASVLNQGPFPPPELPGFSGTVNLSATSWRPEPSHERSVGYPHHAMRLPVLRALPLCTCCRQYPGAALGIIASALAPPTMSAFPENGGRVGPRIVLFEACSAFTRVTACTLATSPYFVTPCSPEASTVSLPPQLLRLLPAGAFRRVGLSPTGKRRLSTAHSLSGHFASPLSRETSTPAQSPGSAALCAGDQMRG